MPHISTIPEPSLYKTRDHLRRSYTSLWSLFGFGHFKENTLSVLSYLCTFLLPFCNPYPRSHLKTVSFLLYEICTVLKLAPCERLLPRGCNLKENELKLSPSSLASPPLKQMRLSLNGLSGVQLPSPSSLRGAEQIDSPFTHMFLQDLSYSFLGFFGILVHPMKMQTLWKTVLPSAVLLTSARNCTGLLDTRKISGPGDGRERDRKRTERALKEST